MSSKNNIKMKDSGIEWIGDVPEDWTIQRIKQSIFSRYSGAWGEEVLENKCDKICIRVADFDYENLSILSNNYTIRNYTDDQIKKLKLKNGDLLIEKSGGGETSPVGRVIIFNQDFDALCANFIEVIRISNNNSSNFFKYLFNMLYSKRVNTKFINQTTGIQNLNIVQYLNEKCPIPPIETQKQIADYLDKKTSVINSIIEKKEKQILLLNEYRKAVITEAVTKGIDRNVTMKKSGIEWIGHIPDDWSIQRIKQSISSRYSGAWGEEVLENKCDKICIRVADFDYENLSILSNNYTIRNYTDDQIKKLKLKNGDLLIEKSGGGEISPVGRVIIFNQDFDALCANFIEVIRISNNNSSNFFKYLFNMLYSKRVNTKFINQTTGIQNLNIVQYLNEKCPIPPIETQKQIADFLDKKTIEIDKSIKNIKAQIKKLKEYKQSLISEAVTGKIESLLYSNKEQKRNVQFETAVLAAKILSELYREPTMGHVKLEKILYLSEHYAKLDFKHTYKRAAAGPFDSKTFYNIKSILRKNKWFSDPEAGSTLKYKKLEKANQYEKYYNKYFSKEQRDKIERIIKLFKNSNSERCEIAATLYAVCDDFFKQNIKPTDEQITNEVLNNWHESKQRIALSMWLNELNWLREKGIYPN